MTCWRRRRRSGRSRSSWLVEVPGIVHHLPVGLREDFSNRCLKAGAAGWLKPRFAKVACHAGRTILGARADAGRITLDLDTGPRTFDHVVLGTGYRIDIAAHRHSLAGASGQDRLRRRFASCCARGSNSSVSKLHFVGSYAVKSFGPLMRFVAGAPYAARAVTSAALGGTRKARSGGVIAGLLRTPHR